MTDEKLSTTKKIDRRYKRLFKKSRQRIFDISKRSLTSAASAGAIEERLVYEKSLPNFPLEILNLVYQYTLVRETATPLENCQKEMDVGENKSTNINHILKLAKLLSRNRTDYPQRVPFEEVKSAIYLLFKNLPVSTYILEKDKDEKDDGGKSEMKLYPFEMSISFPLKNGETDLSIEIKFDDDELKKDYVIEFSEHLEEDYDVETRTVEISIDEVVDLIFYYGSKCEIEFRFLDMDLNSERLMKFNYLSPTTPPYWEVLPMNYDIYTFVTENPLLKKAEPKT